jgi:hypothetical protein
MPKQKIKIEKLPDGSHQKLGRYDNAKRWYPFDDVYNLPGAFTVRSPSRAWPFGYLKHIYTRKFAGILAQHKPLLYMGLQGIDEHSETGKHLIAQHVAMRMKGDA